MAYPQGQPAGSAGSYPGGAGYKTQSVAATALPAAPKVNSFTKAKLSFQSVLLILTAVVDNVLSLYRNRVPQKLIVVYIDVYCIIFIELCLLKAGLVKYNTVK